MQLPAWVAKEEGEEGTLTQGLGHLQGFPNRAFITVLFLFLSPGVTELKMKETSTPPTSRPCHPQTPLTGTSSPCVQTERQGAYCHRLPLGSLSGF